tara:strand:+ start:248 stop:433 length:186 start_codon:yes stop_codon:yes gene_type:complete
MFSEFSFPVKKVNFSELLFVKFNNKTIKITTNIIEMKKEMVLIKMFQKIGIFSIYRINEKN